jgi:hypothetical protein
MSSQVFTDLETLARQMNPPYDGASLLIWGSQPTGIVARLKGGLSPGANTIKQALDSAPPKLALVMPVSADDLARAEYPSVDVVAAGNSIHTNPCRRASDSDRAVLLQVSAPGPRGEYEIFVKRVLVIGETVTVALLRTCYARGVLNLHLLQGPRPQFVGTYELRVDPVTAALAKKLEPPPAAWWQFWKR